MLSMLKNIPFLSKKSNQYLNRKHLSERNILTILPNLSFAWNWSFSSSIEHICKYIFTAFRNFILQVSWVEELCLIGAFIHSKVKLEASSNFRKMTLNNEQLRHFLAVDQWYSKPTNIETLG